MTLLQGRMALVTGGSRGLGRALCEVFAREGADVAFNYASDDEGALETTRRIEAHDQRAFPKKVSVTDRAGLRAWVKELESSDVAIDILVNNAGIGEVLPLALMEESDWDQMMNVHVKGAFLTSQAVLRGMIRRRRGTILNVTSLAGVRMMKAPVHYCTAKAALRGFTESLAKEIGHYGITVNAIAPGLLDEGVGDQVPAEKRAEYLTFCALERLGTSAEVAETAAFLVSSRNTYMNGATVVLDGGV